VATWKDRTTCWKRRYIEGREERIPQLVAELLDRNVDILVASHTGAIGAAKQPTKTVPIVMAGVANPERTGLVESLARPGGNVTGVSNMFGESAPKIVELFKEALPTRSRLGVITVQNNIGDLPASLGVDRTTHDAFVTAASKLRVTLIHESLADAGTIDVALAAVLRQKSEALYVGQRLLAHRVKVGEFAMTHRLPLFTRSPHWPSRLLAFGVTAFGSPQHVFLSSMVAHVGVDPRKDMNFTSIPPPRARSCSRRERWTPISASRRILRISALSRWATSSSTVRSTGRGRVLLLPRHGSPGIRQETSDRDQARATGDLERG
jgi:ABC transporter substrate binding protein